MKTTTTRVRGITRQQEIERHYFEMFQKAFSLPPGVVTHGDKPDVILNGAQKIGIEITNFYVMQGASPSSEQVQRNRRKAVLSKGQRLYEESGGKNVDLAFGFAENHPIQDVGALAKRLAAFAHGIADGENGEILRKMYEDIPELDFAYLYGRTLQYSEEPDPMFPAGQPDISKDFAIYCEYSSRRDARALREGIYKPLSFVGKWSVCQSHDFGLMSTQRLEKIVREKEMKAQHYRPCDAYWLLVVVDFIDTAQEQEIRVDGVVVVSTIFQKIIVYKPKFEHIVEVAVQ